VHALTLEHALPAALLLSQAFGPESQYSWSRPLGLPSGRFDAWLQHAYLPERARHSTPASLVVPSASSSALSGVLAMEDLNTPQEAESESDTAAAAAMAPIDGILSECKEIFWRELVARGVAPTKELGVFGYFAFLGTASDVRRSGVGASLVAAGEKELRRGGFAWGVAFCTSFASSALFRGAGFERWGGVSYQAFAMPDGRRPFESLPQDELALWVKRL